MIQSMRVNNKIKRQLRPQEDLQQILQAIQRNKEHLQSFCSRNNMKFPPVTHSRYGNFPHLSRIRLQPFPAGAEPRSLRKYQSEHQERDQGGKVQWLQKKASICKIMFSQCDRSKSQDASVHSGRLISNNSNDSILKNLHRPKPTFRSQERPVDLGKLTVKHSTLHHFIEGLNFPHGHRQSTSLLSQSLQPAPSKQNRYELLSINRMCTINPEAELMHTLRGRNLAFEKSAAETSRRHFQGKDLSRVSFYKNADGIINPKKNQSLGKKQISMFEPWQGALQEEDFLSEMDK